MSARRRHWWGRLTFSALLAVVLGLALLAVQNRERADRPPEARPEATGQTVDAVPVPQQRRTLGLDDLREVDPASRACLLGHARSAVRRDLPIYSSRWRKDLDEDFDRLDRTRWNVRDQTRLNHDAATLLARNVSTSGGQLAIRARRESVGGRSYTSGYIDTNGIYSLPNTFQIEIRAKVPMLRGLWAAPLWLRPIDHSGGEIDLAETTHRPGEPPRIHHSIHTAYGPNQQLDARRFPSAGIGDPAGTGWHTYTLRKTRGLMVMWVDGEVTAAFCTGSPSWYDTFYDAGKRWNLRINLQVGGWGGRPRPAEVWTDRNATLRVDRVTAWVRKAR